MEALGLDEPPWTSTVLKSMVFIMQIAWRSVEDRTSAGLDGSEKHGFYYADRIEARAHGSEIGFMTQNASRLIESIPRTPVLVHKTDGGYSDDSSSAIQNDRASSTMF